MSTQILPTTLVEREIAACPFCGCASIMETFSPKIGNMEWFVRCYLAECRTVGPSRKTEAEAIDAWNHWLVIAKRTVCPDLSGATKELEKQND